jgi:hypothetical protein
VTLKYEALIQNVKEKKGTQEEVETLMGDEGKSVIKVVR